ncbi:MAG: sel1 repeat family protein [Gammaproteobacteria bacterium]|nr:MAG: sel1 repeat family protein [Gammaproteobacteria bacterium]
MPLRKTGGKLKNRRLAAVYHHDMDRRRTAAWLLALACLNGLPSLAPGGEAMPAQPTETTAEAILAEYARGKALYEAGRYRESFPIFERLAKAGFPQAKMSLAYQYEKGQGVFPNPGQAKRWYLRAANDGLPAAIIALAFQYREGKWVKRNPVLSYALFLVAQRLTPGPAADAMVKAAAEWLSDDQKRLGERLAREMQPGQGAISRIIQQAEKIGEPVL